jgi:hypothetical protein
MTEDDNVRSELAAKAGTRGRLFSWKLAAAETMALLAGQAVLEKY